MIGLIGGANLVKIAVVVIAVGMAYAKGYYDMNQRHQKFVAEVKAIGVAQELINETQIQMSALVTEGIEESYEAKITALRATYAGRLRNQCANGGKMPTVSNAAASTDGTASDPAIIGKCAEATQQLVSLQEWVKKQQGLAK